MLHSLKAVFYTPVMLSQGKASVAKNTRQCFSRRQARTGDMDQHVKVLAAMPGDQSSIPGATG